MGSSPSSPLAMLVQGGCTRGAQRSNLEAKDHNDGRFYYTAPVIKSYLSVLGRPRKHTASSWNSTNDVIQHF